MARCTSRPLRSPMPDAPGQVTRLAPSPTGALHLGNARTFLINWALARQNNWKIVLRIEDLDTPRVKLAGGTVIQSTIDTLRWLGVDWDSGPIIQSADREHHLHAMEQLVARRVVFPNALSRKELEAVSAQSAPQTGSHEAAFPAHLRPANADIPPRFEDSHAAWRFMTPDESVHFRDVCAGEQSINPAQSIGDFVIWTRRDPSIPGQPAYQLAVVVDDHRQGVTHVVRGDDLLDSTARQVHLYRALNYAPLPTYFHLPLVVGPDGRRLAKRHGDSRIETYREQRVTPERVIGLIAAWSGVSQERKPLNIEEFREGFDLRKLPRTPITMTPEDHAWLLRS